MNRTLISISIVLFAGLSPIVAQTSAEKAEAIVAKAVKRLGGDRYLKVATQVTRGRYSNIRDGANVDSQTFLDIFVFPGKERTEFRWGGIKNVQTNAGESGWLYDGDSMVIKVQTDKQIADFKRGMRNSLDHFLRGLWRGNGELTYVGRREAGLGRRSDVVRLTYKEGNWVEFEFDPEGLPLKALYRRTNAAGEETKEEDRFAQFLEVGGITAPFIVDHYVDGKQTSRINFESYEFNRKIDDAVFEKPTDPKVFKRDLKF